MEKAKKKKSKLNDIIFITIIIIISILLIFLYAKEKINWHIIMTTILTLLIMILIVLVKVIKVIIDSIQLIRKKLKNKKEILYSIIIILIFFILGVWLNNQYYYFVGSPRVIEQGEKIYNFKDDLDGDNIIENIKIQKESKAYDCCSIYERKQIALGELMYDGNDTYTISNFKIYINDMLIDEIRELRNVQDVGIYKINNQKGIGFCRHEGWSVTNPTTEIELNILENDKLKKVKYTINNMYWSDDMLFYFDEYGEYTYDEIVKKIVDFFECFEDFNLYFSFNNETNLVNSSETIINLLEENKKYDVLINIEDGKYKLIVDEKT